jgi:predicted RND superfamily exporter protein
LILACLLPLILWGASKIKIGSASAHAWLPEGRVERSRYEWFTNQFGSDQYLVVSWDGCTLSDRRLKELAQKIQELDSQESEKSTGPLIDSLQTSGDLVSSLVDPPLGLPAPVARTRLEGSFIGKDGTAAIFIRFNPEGIASQSASIELVRSAADQVQGLGREQLQMVGSIYEAYAVDQAAEKSLRKLVIPSSLMGVLLAWICLRSVRGAITVLLIAGIGQLIAVAVVATTGGEFSAVLIVLPTLVFMLTLSAAVHFMNYYGDVAYSHRDHLGSRAILLGLKPSALATVTTSLGMIALATSQLSPVRTFGLYSASCLCLATLVLFLAFPKLSDWLCSSRYLVQTTSDIHDKSQFTGSHDSSPPVAPWATTYAAWVQSNYLAICIGGFSLLAISFYGLWHLKSSTKFDDMFPVKSQTRESMAWIEEHLGPIASVEVLLKFPNPSELEPFDQLVWVDRVTQELRSNPDIGGVASAVTFLPKLPSGGRIRDVSKRAVMRTAVSKQFNQLVKRGLVSQDADSTAWRITAKVSALSKLNYGELTERVRQTVEPIQQEQEEFKVIYTGLSPVMHDTQLALLDDLGSSFTTAFLLITPVMMLIARGIRAGLLIMVPNILPETLVFGMMAWLGYSIDIAGILTASVAMGIAVNDTLHFVNWYSHRLAVGDTREQAVADAFSNCGRAMIHTMLISCCSMVPFLFAEFNPTRQFATLMIAMMSSSILGDLVLLPALLLSPLGRTRRSVESIPTS